MTRTKYLAYLQSSWWKRCRYQALCEAEFCCQQCGRHGHNSPYGHYGLEVHHRSYKNLGHEPRKDLQALCPRCHAAEHGLEESVAGFARMDSIVRTMGLG